MTTPARDQDHEWNFNPRKAVPDVERYNRRALEKSQAARRAYDGRYDVRYGADSLATLDVFPAAGAAPEPASEPDAPIHVYLHGGYWRGRDKGDYSYIANALVPHGITTVAMNYDLCPSATLPEIVAQVRAGLRWIHENARTLGGAPDKITVSGHSAGAHLAAMALADDSPDPLPAGAIGRAVLISGIFELTPVLRTTVNEQIRLTPDLVAPMSPFRHLPRTDVPLVIVVGGDEPPGWVAQSRDFAEACRANGSPVDYHEIEGHHHFSIMTLLEDRDGPLTRIVANQAGGY